MQELEQGRLMQASAGKAGQGWPERIDVRFTEGRELCLLCFAGSLPTLNCRPRLITCTLLTTRGAMQDLAQNLSFLFFVFQFCQL